MQQLGEKKVNGSRQADVEKGGKTNPLNIESLEGLWFQKEIDVRLTLREGRV